MLGKRVRYIDKLPDCIPKKGEGIVIAETQTAVVVSWDNGEVFIAYPDDLEVLE
jgi:hypothetical protein